MPETSSSFASPTPPPSKQFVLPPRPSSTQPLHHNILNSPSSESHIKHSPVDGSDAAAGHSILTALKGKGKEPAADSINDPSPSTTSPKRASTAAQHLEQYISRDQIHSSALLQQSNYATNLIREKRDELQYYQQLRRDRTRFPGAVFGYGYAGYGNGTTDGNARVLYPCQRKRPGGRKARELRLSKQQLQTQAEQSDILVPIRLDIDYDNKIKLRDTFTWNMHDRTVPLELFVEQLIEDFHLPLHQQLLNQVTNSIREQVRGFHPHVFFTDDALDPMLPYTAYKNDDMRVLIKLNITIGQHTLVDQFEWDINNPLNNPEEFAQLLTREFSLSGEFTTAIAHSIREQCQLFTKALFVTSHPFDGRPVEDEDVRSAMLQSPIVSVFRPHAHQKDYTPLLYELSENELERAEKSQSREARRLKRVGRRGGPMLPDLKDMPKTHRTQIVSSTLPGAVQKVSELEKSMSVKHLKDGDSDDDESDSDGEDLPPEKTIPGYNSMTRRQKLAAINAQRASKEMYARSQTPEHRDRSDRFQDRQRHETPMKPSNLSVPPSIMSPLLPPLKLPRRDGVPLHQDSGLLIVKISRMKLQKVLNDIERRAALAQIKKQQAAAQAEARIWEAAEEAAAAEKERMDKEKAEKQQKEEKVKVCGDKGPETEKGKEKPSEKKSTASPMATEESSKPSMKAPGVASTSPPNTSTPSTSTPPEPRSNPSRPDPQTPPAAPAWLQKSLAILRESYPADNFEETMRWTAFDPTTDLVIPQAQLATFGKDVVCRWSPRIRCHDCPGKLYTPGPGMTCENFLMHLKNRTHRERVDIRVSKTQTLNTLTAS